MREKTFPIRMSDEERERAERVAKHHGLNVAGVIRTLLMQEDRRIAAQEGFASEVAKPTKATRKTKKR